MKTERKSENFRQTSETEIYCKVNIDGNESCILVPLVILN